VDSFEVDGECTADSGKFADEVSGLQSTTKEQIEILLHLEGKVSTMNPKHVLYAHTVVVRWPVRFVTAIPPTMATRASWVASAPSIVFATAKTANAPSLRAAEVTILVDDVGGGVKPLEY